MAYKYLLTEIADSIAIVRMNRPDALNAINSEVLSELEECFCELGENEQVRVIILTGEGKAFVAGADIAEMKDLDEDQARKFSALGQKIFRQIETLDKPVIAAINGFALGGGCELAMACDFRIASQKAKLGQPEVSLGVIPGFAGTQRLARIVGEGRAKEIIFTAEIIDAQTALSIGLVNKVVPAEELMNVTLGIAKKVVTKGPESIRLAKEVINRGIQVDLDTGTALENEAFGKTFASGEAKEGLSAFLEKRKPKW